MEIAPSVRRSVVINALIFSCFAAGFGLLLCGLWPTPDINWPRFAAGQFVIAFGLGIEAAVYFSAAANCRANIRQSKPQSSMHVRKIGAWLALASAISLGVSGTAFLFAADLLTVIRSEHARDAAPAQIHKMSPDLKSAKP